MRLVANIALVAAAASLGLALGGFALTVTAAPPPDFVPPEPAGENDARPVAAVEFTPIWPPVFGTVPPPPQLESAPLPEPEPEIRYDYLLTGLVADRGASWALISLGGIQQIVRVGDTLEGGEIVTKIDHQGVWADWQGQPQLIPVNRQDLSHMVHDTTQPDAAAPAADGGEVSVILERLDRRALSETLEGAGTLVLTPRDDGGQSLDVVWIRQGELYDRIGLRTGDKILRINGETVENSDLLAHMPDAITNGGTIALEILRDGTRQVIKVNLGQG